MKRIASLQGFREKLKTRSDSKNRDLAATPVSAISARKPTEKPPKFSMSNLKKITGMSARGEKESEGRPPMA